MFFYFVLGMLLGLHFCGLVVVSVCGFACAIGVYCSLRFAACVVLVLLSWLGLHVCFDLLCWQG